MTDFQLRFIIIFFVYGLAFFSMGLAMIIEVGRSPLLAEGRILRPLAVFGLLHGTHEWMEIFILELHWVNVEIPLYWSWIRLVLLAVSFVSLIAYGVQVLRPPEQLAAMDAWVGSGFLALYAAVVVLVGTVFWQDMSEWISRSDILARYILAVPGAILAGLALFSQANQARLKNRQALFLSLRVAALGFLFYGVTQIFVSEDLFFPANRLNSTTFLDVTGIPVQLVRAFMAAIITTSLIKASQIVENERQAQFLRAQDERLEALERVQVELEKREDLRRELLRNIVIAQEEERTRISRELHDELAQTLTGFSLDLATLKMRCAGKEFVTSAVERLQDLSRQMSQGLHRLVHDLRPAQLDDLGLVPALQHLIEDIRERANIEIDVDISGESSRMDPLVETVLYRVTQETLTNIIRHAQTKRATLNLEFQAEQIVLQIRDFGVGFNTETLESLPTRLGIAGMRERVRSVDGQFKLESEPGKGTHIKVFVPCPHPQDIPEGEN
ncbi:MAG: Oxygen sensor histidine kinase NreB [Chloroflexi bacterium]|nr:Oxygen sensor histidine kinase NreB [Chloroflexota bacterium]